MKLSEEIRYVIDKYQPCTVGQIVRYINHERIARGLPRSNMLWGGVQYYILIRNRKQWFTDGFLIPYKSSSNKDPYIYYDVDTVTLFTDTDHRRFSAERGLYTDLKHEGARIRHSIDQLRLHIEHEPIKAKQEELKRILRFQEEKLFRHQIELERWRLAR